MFKQYSTVDKDFGFWVNYRASDNSSIGHLEDLVRLRELYKLKFSSIFLISLDTLQQQLLFIFNTLELDLALFALILTSNKYPLRLQSPLQISSNFCWKYLKYESLQTRILPEDPVPLPSKVLR